MKKRVIALLLCMTTVLTYGGCGKDASDKQNATQAETQNAAQETYKGKSSAQMDIDLSKLVTKLADYDNIKVSISGDYDVTDKKIEERIIALLAYCGVTGIERKDRDTVQKGDYVMVDFTGYHNGEAFDNGAATDVMIDVSNNCQAGQQGGYIDGFSDGLIGAKVGTEVSSDVKFPDEYTLNPDLAGEMTTFKFNVKGIYDPITMDNLTDDMVKDTFKEAEITTKEELVNNMRAMLESQSESSHTQDKITAVEDYLSQNSEVTIPEEYMQARLAEMEAQYKHDYCTEKQTLEEYFKLKGTTLEVQRGLWRQSLKTQITVEFLLSRIAELESMEIDEDGYNQFIDNIINSENNSLTSKDEVYDYYGNGNKEDGEKNLRRQYLTNDALAYLIKNADITEQKVDDSTQE